MAGLATEVPYTLHLGSVSLLSDGTTGALSDTKKLKKPAVGILFSAAASGDLKIGYPDGSTTTIVDGEVAKGVLIPMRIAQVFSTGSTLAAAGFRLAVARYLWVPRSGSAWGWLDATAAGALRRARRISIKRRLPGAGGRPAPRAAGRTTA